MRVDLNRLECRSAFELPGRKVVLRQRPDGGTHPPIEMVELRDVLYLPNVLELGQSVCLADREVVPLESVLDCSAVDFLMRTRQERGHGERYDGDFVPTDSPAAVCILGNLFSRNFGHWTEELLKVAILERLEVDCSYALADLPPFAMAFLTALGVPENRILRIAEPTRFRRAVFTTAISHGNIGAYPWALDELRGRLNATGQRHRDGPGARLWLERSAPLHNGGVTLNQDEVDVLIGRFGFQTVDMASLTVAQQLSAVRTASVVAGPHGAQFVHVQFMPRASTVIECFSPVHVNPSVLQLCRVLDHSYRQVVSRSHVVAPYQHGRDCWIDCEHLAVHLAALSTDRQVSAQL